MMASTEDADAGLLLHFGGGGGGAGRISQVSGNNNMDGKQRKEGEQQQHHGKPMYSTTAAGVSTSATRSCAVVASPSNSTDGSTNDSAKKSYESTQSSSFTDMNDSANKEIISRASDVKLTNRNGDESGKSSGSNQQQSEGGDDAKKSGSSIKKKKKKKDKSRRGKKSGMNRKAMMARDTTVHALRTLRSIVFQKENNISNPFPIERKGRQVTNDLQFEDAPEPVDHARLRQHHSSDYASKIRPPFGYFSIHPSSLSLHSESAVRHFYPLTINLMGGARQEPQLHVDLDHQQTNTRYHEQHRQEHLSYTQHPSLQNHPPSVFNNAFATDPTPGHHGSIAQMHQPHMATVNYAQHHPQMQQAHQAQMSQQHQAHLQQQRHQHSGMIPGTTHHPLVNTPTNHLPTTRVPGLTYEQQAALLHQYQQQTQHQNGRPPPFLEYAAAFVKRQQLQQQQQQQQ